jgi:hypothetical protein
VIFTVPTADLPDGGYTNQLYVDVYDRENVVVDGVGGVINAFKGAPITLASTPTFGTVSLTENADGDLTATLPVTKGILGGTVTATMHRSSTGVEFGDYLDAAVEKPGTLSFTIPGADFEGTRTNWLLITVYNSAGEVVYGTASTASMLAPGLEL